MKQSNGSSRIRNIGLAGRIISIEILPDLHFWLTGIYPVQASLNDEVRCRMPFFIMRPISAALMK